MGCGGGSPESESDSEADGNVLVGSFIDSAVEGLSYTTDSQSGVTNAQGEFNYQDGESGLFALGQFELPLVLGKDTITPREIFDTNNLSDRRVVNLARLLQSLDQNDTLSDGISFSESVISGAPLSSSVNFDVDLTEFENNPAVLNLVAANGTVLVDSFDALRHMQDSLIAEGKLSLVDPIEWADISRGTTHSYDNGASYFYREDGVRLSLEPWIDGIQETTWFVSDDDFFCEVSTDGNTYCFGYVDNSTLVVDDTGSYFYSDAEFDASFTVTPGNTVGTGSTSDSEGTENSPPRYRYELGDQEGEASLANNVISISSSISTPGDSNKQRNRLIVDTENRFIADLAVTEAVTGDAGRVQARIYMKLYNDTVNSNETVPVNSLGEIELSVSLELEPSGSELIFYACASRSTIDDDEPAYIFNGESCFNDPSPVQIGKRLKMGAEFDKESGTLSIIRNDSSFDFQLTGPLYPRVEYFNRLSVIARDGQSRITTEIYGITSENFDDDFSNGVRVEGINQ